PPAFAGFAERHSFMNAFRSSPFPSPNPLSFAWALQAAILLCFAGAAMANGARHSPDTKADITMMQAVFVMWISFGESGRWKNARSIANPLRCVSNNFGILSRMFL